MRVSGEAKGCVHIKATGNYSNIRAPTSKYQRCNEIEQI